MNTLLLNQVFYFDLFYTNENLMYEIFLARIDF